MNDAAIHETSIPRTLNEDRRQFRLIYMLSFVAFLIAVMLERLVFWRRNGVHSKASIIDEAKSAANSCIPFAFTG